ncbi:hypothetical protein B0H34DRAFT_792032 [Crassisporium funariophilum]|nr:hypothetical protein B0H34DRAFT_792032 [Crassisporium funariophilum]
MTSKVISQSQPVPTASPGVADIVGFGNSGVVILRNSIFVQLLSVIPNFGYDAGGWRVEKHVRLLADTTGDRQADVVGFGEGGVYISVNNGNNTFQAPKMVLSDFAYAAGGWRVDKHIRFMADTRKTGRADVVGFGDGGVIVAKNNGNGTFNSGALVLADFGYNAGGWRMDKHLRFLADVNGNGLPDIVAFGENQVIVALNNGNGFQSGQGVIQDLCYSDASGGWRIEKHPRIVADMTGDGKADIVGFGNAGVIVAFNNGNGTFQTPKLVKDNFGYNAGGWRVEKHPRFVADLTGSKRGDIVGFGDAGVYISINNGDGSFQAVKRVIDNFGYIAGGWRVEKHLRFPVDLTGDGCADIIGFGETAVYVSYNDGKGSFGPVQKLVDGFAYNGGEWSLEKTVRYVANLYLN